MDTNPEDIATWLARETGHSPTSDEGYEGDESTEGKPKRLGLPQDKHEKLRRFFDGLHVEKELTAKRRNEAVEGLDEADAMNQALKQTINPAQGGAY